MKLMIILFYYSVTLLGGNYLKNFSLRFLDDRKILLNVPMIKRDNFLSILNQNNINIHFTVEKN